MEETLWYMQRDILEIIFSHLDGVSLSRAQQVCALWNEVLRDMYERTSIWQKCCEKEIPNEVLEEITSNLYPGWSHCGTETNWHCVYKAWRRWMRKRKTPCTVRSVFSSEERLEWVTSVKASGSCIVTGHKDGSIKFWSRFSGFLGGVFHHARAVTDLGLMIYNPKGNLFIQNTKWDVRHNLLISTSKDRSIKIINLETGFTSWSLTCHLMQTCMVRSYKEMFAVLSLDDIVSLWKICSLEFDKEPPLLIATVAFQQLPVCAISIWRYKFSGLSVDARRFWRDKICPGDLAVLDEDFVHFEGVTECQMLEAHAWRDNIYTWITSGHTIYVAVDNKAVQYNTMQDLRSYPVTILLYGNILFLGMESGDVILYFFKDREDLLNLDLKNHHRRFSFQHSPVSALDIVEYDTCTAIVVGTLKNVYCVNLVY
ncbi:uncharacterized protein LOC126282046 [Schistocerca gregaria]|uniref:uncharacterized protein LOC126282046 n=1 Tax=Schistocerca gregaria TaxID=7010 RepID=UPI00211EFED2|nr:uncharacterized protein LOC126282046 [Schistocerca gregaria]